MHPGELGLLEGTSVSYERRKSTKSAAILRFYFSLFRFCLLSLSVISRDRPTFAGGSEGSVRCLVL